MLIWDMQAVGICNLMYVNLDGYVPSYEEHIYIDILKTQKMSQCMEDGNAATESLTAFMEPDSVNIVFNEVMQ
jgi:hypothetical protein